MSKNHGARWFAIWMVVAVAFLLQIAPLQASPGVSPEDAKHIMPLSQIKRGMRGYGLTVFHGTKIEKFDVEILGVLKKMNTGKDLILVRIGGGPITSRDTGIIAGMSGSPCYINGKLVGAAPLFYTPNYQGVPCLMLVGSVEVSDYLDVIAAPADLPAFLEGLMPYLTAGGMPPWKRLDWYNLPQDTPTQVDLETAVRRQGWSFEARPVQPSPYITLPGNWEDYLMTVDKKQRHEIRRKLRRLELAPIPSRWYILDEAMDLQSEMDAFLDMMAQDADKKRFLTPQMRRHMHNTARFARDAGILHLSFLEIDGEKAAGKFCFSYNNRLLAYNSAVNFDFMEYSPGWVLLSYILKWANEQAFEEFDFMRGDENYKYRFGAVDRFVLRAVVNRQL